MKRALVFIGLILPLQVFALEFRNLSLLYTDAPFNPDEAAGISLLTSVGAVQGDPDGAFRPKRTLNRAEFLKIALASYPKVRVSSSDADKCFPDINAADWFSPYVCLAKKRGMVSGYPDGTFKPERSVNYVEALKILGELYGYIAYSAPDEEWYAGYVRAAEFNKTALPSSIKYDRPLTRGQMARLAAAYRAQFEGQLDTYRLSERSFDLVIAQEKQQSSSISSIASTSSSSVSFVSSVSSQSISATSHFLVLGSTKIIASGTFQPQGDSATIENVTVQFVREPKNISSLWLIDTYGTKIAELKPVVTNKTGMTWRGERDPGSNYLLPSGGKELGIEATIKAYGQGYSGELMEVKTVTMNVRPVGNNTVTYELVAQDTSYPAHQTAFGRITSVRNDMPSIVDMEQGENVRLAAFEIKGEHVGDAQMQVQHLVFTISKQRGVLLSSFSLGSNRSADTVACSVEAETTINCENIPVSIGAIDQGGTLVQLLGTIDTDASVNNQEFQIDLAKPGIISTTNIPGELGSVRWSDGSSAFSWIESDEPVAAGSLWK